MLSDNVSIALALFAVWIAAKPPTPERTFGFRRVEILAALANGATLVAVSFWIFSRPSSASETPRTSSAAGCS
jgi:cobalt-zinc-cadmium efflux system protein